MRLNQFTDYSLRVLIYLGLQSENRVTIDEITDAYSVSRHHIRSVVHKLSQLGYIESVQGKGGGLMLALDAKDISVREVVENTENDFYIVVCFNPNGNACPIEPMCVLKQALSKASLCFLEALDQYTIEDLIKNKKRQLRNIFENAL